MVSECDLETDPCTDVFVDWVSRGRDQVEAAARRDRLEVTEEVVE